MLPLLMMVLFCTGRAMNQLDTDKVLKYLAEDPVIRVSNPDKLLWELIDTDAFWALSSLTFGA